MSYEFKTGRTPKKAEASAAGDYKPFYEKCLKLEDGSEWTHVETETYGEALRIRNALTTWSGKVQRGEAKVGDEKVTQVFAVRCSIERPEGAKPCNVCNPGGKYTAQFKLTHGEAVELEALADVYLCERHNDRALELAIAAGYENAELKPITLEGPHFFLFKRAKATLKAKEDGDTVTDETGDEEVSDEEAEAYFAAKAEADAANAKQKAEEEEGDVE
jgi:hypothetical protein